MTSTAKRLTHIHDTFELGCKIGQDVQQALQQNVRTKNCTALRD